MCILTRLTLALAATLALVTAGTAQAAPARTGTLSDSATDYKWTGPLGFGVVTFSGMAGLPGCGTALIHDCDYTLLHVTTPGKVTVKTTAASSPTTIDVAINIYASDASGTKGKPKAAADSTGGSNEANETGAFTSDTPDAYWLVEVEYLDVVAGSYDGEAQLAPGVGVEPDTVAPTIKITSPKAKKTVKSSKLKSISGTAADDGSVAKVEVAVLTGKGSKCKSLNSKGSFSKAKCAAPTYLPAKGTTKWSYKLKKKLKKGTYVVLVKATDDTGDTATAQQSLKVK
jgi:Bacterial Ig domain